MITRDYIKTIGHEIEQPRVPLPFALLLIAAIGAVGFHGFRTTWPVAHGSGGENVAAATPSVPVVVAGK